MRLEDYFDFLAPTDIRIKGSRIGIETVLFEYLEKGKTPEQIQQEYPNLTIEEVYATIMPFSVSTSITSHQGSEGGNQGEVDEGCFVPHDYCVLI